MYYQSKKDIWANGAQAVQELWGKFNPLQNIRNEFVKLTSCPEEVFTARSRKEEAVIYRGAFCFLASRGLNTPLNFTLKVIPSFGQEHTCVMHSANTFAQQMDLKKISFKPSPQLSYGLGVGCRAANTLDWNSIPVKLFLKEYARATGVSSEDLTSGPKSAVLSELRTVLFYLTHNRMRLGSRNDIVSYFGFSHNSSLVSHKINQNSEVLYSHTNLRGIDENFIEAKRKEVTATSNYLASGKPRPYLHFHKGKFAFD